MILIKDLFISLAGGLWAAWAILACGMILEELGK